MIRPETKMARALALAAATLFLAVTAAAATETVKISGKQTAGSINKGAQTETKDVKIGKEAKIVKVEGTAQEYCIWKRPGSRGYLCGDNKKRKIVGKTLPPGTYFVIPGLTGSQRSAQVTISLEIE
jgi:hypothetical protein